ncbi:MAG: hypothetical protein ACI4KF_02300 [Huintestinicola sp.]
MKCNIGIDAGSGLVHSITAASANVHDITEAAQASVPFRLNRDFCLP